MLRFAAHALGGSCAATVFASCDPQPIPLVDYERRHVALLTVDTLRADHVRRDGGAPRTMPFVDSLLASGFRFTRAITPLPRTSPALASLMTGSHPHTHGVRHLFGTLGSDVSSLAELLRSEGYSTIAVVSNAVLGRERELDRGFDVYDTSGMVEHDAVRTTDRVIQHLESKTSADRIFLWVLYIDPHVPYFPPRELARSFDPTYRGRYRWHFGSRGVGETAYPADLGKARAVFRNDLPEPVNRHVRQLYAADVRHADNEIARLVNWLRERFGRDWLIVFTSDHGESLGEHDFHYDHGDYVYNATLHVPLGIVFGEDDPLRGEGEIDSWVSLIDVMPTLMELLGIEATAAVEKQIEGRSLVPHLRGESLPDRPLFAESGKAYFPEEVKRRVQFDVAGRFRTVVLGDWKLIWTPGLPAEEAYELYDLARDPGETRNVYSADHPQVPALQAHLKTWRARARAPAGLASPSEADREALCALGYLECP